MNSMLPMQKMWERIEVARQDSDTTLFFHLLYAGEMLTKLVAAGLVAAIADDRERHRYRQLHRLVRAEGLGEWVQSIDDVLIGPASQHLREEARDDQREMTQKLASDTWQHKAVHRLHQAVKRTIPEREDPPTKVQARQWFHEFVALRNRTRGHGAITPSACHKVCNHLEASIREMADNLSLLQRPWAYLHQNLSGKYRVIALGGDASCFQYLKTSDYRGSGAYENLQNGAYVHYGRPVCVDLITTNVDVADFFFPNGAYNGRTFELFSYISDNRIRGDATPYQAPAAELPPSETHGLEALDVIGESFANLPPLRRGYVSRPFLEEELYNVLTDDRHPVISLVGRGGIGKTSLAIAVLYDAAKRGPFEAILWFSARDIDLLPEGPKLVSPRVLTMKEIAEEFVNCLNPQQANERSFDSVSYLAKALTKSLTRKPFLFVFDNFETVRDPVDLFAWLDAHVRLPNKVLITTRHREFKADYPIEVAGMRVEEADKLITLVSGQLGIDGLLKDQYREQVYQESDGHPYIIKVLLGEVAKARRLVKVERIIAAKDEMLDALFERTYAGLSPVAKRVLLSLCRWRSLVPKLALEAVLLRPTNEKMDVEAAVEELVRSSFAEIVKGKDDAVFLEVPLAASIFGRRKIETSPMKTAIEADVELLQVIGATQESGLRHGIHPRIQRLFQYVAKEVGQDPDKVGEYLAMLEFVCRQYPPAWLMLVALYEESGTPASLSKAKEAVRRLLERARDPRVQREGWEKLARLCNQTGDWLGEIHALVAVSKIPGEPISTVSNAANRVNALFRQGQDRLVLDSDEKRVIVREVFELMSRRASECDATDLSRLAWLCLHLHDEERAKAYTEKGLIIDGSNAYCINLAERLGLL